MYTNIRAQQIPEKDGEQVCVYILVSKEPFERLQFDAIGMIGMIGRRC